MDLSQITIETERLNLVPVAKEHAKEIFQEYREPITQFMNYGAPDNLASVESRIQQRVSDMKAGLQLYMVVLQKDSGEFLGCFALEDLSERNPELGGWLKKAAHGKRYGQEVARALKQWADKNLDYDNLVWPCATANTSSRKLAESLGGTIHKQYEKKNNQGSTLDYLEYWIPKKSS